jgi:hypothetical protein
MTNVLTKQGDKAPNCQGLAWCSNKRKKNMDGVELQNADGKDGAENEN